MMKIGGRVGFDRVEELPWHYQGIDFPIELALPYRYMPDWGRVEGRLNEIAAFFREEGTRILSMHATQGRISSGDFLRWGKKTLEFAEALGVTDITVHPNRARRGDDRVALQAKALANLGALGDTDKFSVETFGGKGRILRPAEIVDMDIPMTLDTAHLHDRAEVLGIVDDHHRKIRTVHLSAIGEKEHHLPIDHFCLTVVERLKGLGWEGNVILEYLPWHHYRVRDDIEALTRFVEEGEYPVLLPASDRFRDDPEMYGYNRDGTNG